MKTKGIQNIWLKLHEWIQKKVIRTEIIQSKTIENIPTKKVKSK